MKVEKFYNGKRYTFSNEGLKPGDNVFPIANGRCLDGGDYILHNFNFSNVSTGFPDDPHTIIDLKHSPDYKPYEVKTDKGYSPIERYYKVIKVERQVDRQSMSQLMFNTTEWIVEFEEEK